MAEEVNFKIRAERSSGRTVADCWRKRVPNLGCDYSKTSSTKQVRMKGVPRKPEPERARRDIPIIEKRRKINRFRRMKNLVGE